MSYTNMTAFTEGLTSQQILEHSKKISLDMTKPGKSPLALSFMKHQKITALNYFSAKLLVTSCDRLVAADRTALTGIYKLYPTQSLLEPYDLLCEFNKGRLISQTDLGKSVKDDLCSGKISCAKSTDYFKEIACIPLASSTNECLAEGVTGLPVLIKKTTQAVCLESDYGFNIATSILWVKNNCGGIFQMPIIPKVEIPVSQISWNQLGPNFLYSLDFQKVTGLTKQNINACISTRELMNSSGYGFDGVCNEEIFVPVDMANKVRVCAVQAGQQSIDKLCSEFVSLTKKVSLILPSGTIKPVIGWLEAPVVSNGQVSLTGWACEEGSTSSARVIFFADDGKTPREMIGTAVAGINAEAAVSTACKTTASTYRFKIDISKDKNLSLENKKISAVAVASDIRGSRSTELKRVGGEVVFPAVGRVIGFVEQTTITANNLNIKGWACSLGSKDPIWIHVYANGAAGVGKFLGAALASNNSEAEVGTKCLSAGVAHRFSAGFYSTANLPIGTSIFVHGISPSGDVLKNLLLQNSGVLKATNGQPPQVVEQRSGSDR